MVDEAVLPNTVAEEQQENYENAIFAQVEYWIEIGDSVDIVGPFETTDLGTLKISSPLKILAPRARRFLLLSGLLYRGL